MPDRQDEIARVRIPLHDRRLARLAALEHSLARVEAQAAFQLLRLGAVALVATVHQDGADSLLEEFGAGGSRGRRLRGITGGRGADERRDSREEASGDQY